MTHTPPLPEAATSPYPIEEAPHEHPTGPNGEPIHFATAEELEPARLTTEAKALIGVAAALALGTVGALAAALFRKPKAAAPKRRTARKTASRKPVRRTAAA